MNKAQQYVEELAEFRGRKEPPRPEFEVGGGRIARVNDCGVLCLFDCVVPSDQTLAFARWILDTFSDPPPLLPPLKAGLYICPLCHKREA